MPAATMQVRANPTDAILSRSSPHLFWDADLDEGEVQLYQGYASTNDVEDSRLDAPQSVETIKFDQMATLARSSTSLERVFLAQRSGQWNALHFQLRLRNGRDVPTAETSHLACTFS